MIGLDSLPPLPSISSSTADNSPKQSVASKVVDAATTATAGAMFGGITLQRVTLIILGLLLVAAGIFAFKPVRETVVATTKEGAKAAAMA